MSEIKLNLSIVLPGRVIFSKEECLKTIQRVIKRSTKSGNIYSKTIEVQETDWNRVDKHSIRVISNSGKESDTLTFYTRKCRPATQSINMSKEAYEYMIDKNSCPSWSKPGKWAAMSEKERLEAHLQRTVEHLGGVGYTYQVFED